MAKVINADASATGVSSTWTPTADFVVEVIVAADNPVVMQVETRLDALADWVGVVSFVPNREPLVSVVKLPEVRLTWVGSKSAISAWSV